MSGFAKASYSGPTGLVNNVAICPGAPIATTVYQNTTAKAVFISGNVQCEVIAAGDVAEATFSIGPTNTPNTVVAQPNTQLGGTALTILPQYTIGFWVPAGWYWSYTKTVGGTGAVGVEGFTAVY